MNAVRILYRRTITTAGLVAFLSAAAIPMPSYAFSFGSFTKLAPSVLKGGTKGLVKKGAGATAKKTFQLGMKKFSRGKFTSRGGGNFGSKKVR